MFDFANILFSGPCNARCYFCIGKQIPAQLNQSNLDIYPLKRLEPFIDKIKEHKVNQVVLTGSNTDPQLYKHEDRLLQYLRQRLPTGTKISLHTNGWLAISKMEVFNQYDRATISLPTFHRSTYHQMMGRRGPPDLAAILEASKIPIKISCILTPWNADEIPSFLQRCCQLGVRRVVLRNLFDQQHPADTMIPRQRIHWKPHVNYRSNPVYLFQNMEVTIWDFTCTQSKSLNLFSNGTISENYLLANGLDSTVLAKNTPGD